MPLLKLKNASYPEPDALALVNEYDLGRDGSKWRHGWQPLNPAAVAIKAKKSPGHGGGKTPATGSAAAHSELSKVHEHNGNMTMAVAHQEAAKRAASATVSGKSRLSTSTVRPSRAKVAGAKGREASPKPKSNSFADELTARSVASRQAHADSLGVHQTSKGTGVTGVSRPEFKTMAQRRKEAAPRAFVNSGDVRLHATKDDGGSKIGTVSKYPSGGFRAQHKDDATAHAGSPFATRQEAVGALVLQHESRTPKTQAERVADIRSEKSMTSHDHVVAAVESNDKAVAAMKRGDLKTANDHAEAARHHNQQAMQKASADEVMKLRAAAEGTPQKNLVDAEIARRLGAKVQVYNVQTGKVEHVSPAEATAGHARFGQSLGAGTPAGGQTVKNALEAEQARRAAVDPKTTNSTGLRTLGGYGTNDLKAIANQKGAYASSPSSADTIAKAEAELKSRGYVKGPTGVWAKPKAPQRKQKAATLKGRATPVKRGTNSIAGVRFNRGEGGAGK